MAKPQLLQDLGMQFPTIKSKTKRRVGLFKCFCGNEFVSQIFNVKNGNTNSCGCYKIQRCTESNIKHNKTHTRLYNIWDNMKARYYNPKSASFKNYGERGIKICDE